MKGKIVLKVGGSLVSGDNLLPLCHTISSLGKRHSLLVVPGGGQYADLVRMHYRKYCLSESTSHLMAILAMEQQAYLLANLIPGSRMVHNPRAFAAGNTRGVFVWAGFSYLAHCDKLAASWEVTSDSMAAFVSCVVGAELLVLLKDQDGVLNADPRFSPGTSLIPRVTRKELSRYRCTDSQFARYLPPNTSCWVINGNQPQRLIQLLDQGKTLGTEVV